MANQQNSYTGDQGSGQDNAFFDFTFPSFTTSEVKVEVDNVVKTLTTHYTVENYNSTSGGKVKFTANNIPSGSGTSVRIFRQTNVETPKAEFTAGSSLKANEINDNFKQVRHALQEAIGAAATDRKIQRFNIEADAIDGTLIADDVINSEHYVAGSIDHEHLANDIIDGDNIQDDVINSEHYAASSIDEEHIANSAVTSNKIADNAVTTTEILNGAVTRAKLEADIIDGSKLVDNAIDSEHYTDGSIDRVHLEADIIDSSKLADASVNSEHYVDGSIDRVHLEADIIDSTKLADNAVGSEHIQTNAVTDSEIATGTLDNRYYTKTQSDAAYFNVSTGDTIKDGDAFPDNDTTIATTAAINDRIIDLVDDVGGFVPIANETAFPTTNPDLNNGPGTLISIREIASTRTPNTGTVTIANGAGSNTVTISDCGSTVLTAGFGVIVETTSVTHTYQFHRLVPKATEVTAVADKATEIGRLGTAAAVEDMSILGTTDVVADMAILGTTDVVSDMNTLGTADVVADMNTLAVTSVINNMDTVAGISGNVTTVAGIASDVTAVAADASDIGIVAADGTDIGLVAGSIGNVNNVGNSITNVNTVATNIASVNNFADQYRIGSSNPTTSLDTGDLFFNTSTNSLKVYTGSAWVDGVTQTGNFALKTGNTFTGSNIYNDNVKSIYGTGSDLEIYHATDNSYINNTNGTLRILSNNHIVLEQVDGDNLLRCDQNGAVNLYWDNSLKLNTKSDGILVQGEVQATHIEATGSSTFSGNVGHGDNVKALFGTGSDLEIYHNGSNSYLKNSTGWLNILSNTVFLGNYADTEAYLKAVNNGSVELYYDHSKKFETTTNGALCTGTFNSNNGTVSHSLGNELVITRGSQAISINANNAGANSYSIINTTAPNGVYLAVSGTNVVVARADKFEVYKDLRITADNEKLLIGLHQDLELYHDGTDSKIDNNTGDLYIQTTGSGDDILLESADDIVLNVNGSNYGIYVAGGAQTELYWNANKRLATSNLGVNIFGGSNYGNLWIYTDDGNKRGGIYADNSELVGFVDDQNHFLAFGAKDNHFTLRYDQSTKLATTASGVKISGELEIDSGHLRGDSTNGLRMFSDSTATHGITLTTSDHLVPSTDSTSDLGLTGTRWRNVYADTLYGDGSNLTGITSVGGANSVSFNDDVRAKFGNSDDLQIYHDGSHSYLKDSGTGNLKVVASVFQVRNAADNETMIEAHDNGQVEIYHNDSKVFNTEINGVRVNGGEGGPAILYMYSDEGDDLADKWKVEVNDTASDYTIYSLNNSSSWETSIRCVRDAQTELYYNNGKKLETYSGGVLVTGELRADDDIRIQSSYPRLYLTDTDNNNDYSLINNNGNFLIYDDTANEFRMRIDGTTGSATMHWIPTNNNTYDLGSSSYKWRNIYTNDLHLSNEGHSNDVDGTWGNWTIQEGESDLFLKNNRSGKKYKFNLTEVA